MPARVKIGGRYVELEPLHRRHAQDLWRALQSADDSFAYVPFGPFASFAAFERFIAEFAAEQARLAWAIRPISTGEASGWLTLMDIQPANAAIEIGSIWFGPKLQRTKAATEAIYLLLKLAADDLGYRRLVWKCNARNGASKRAAERLGFTHKGGQGSHRSKMHRARARRTAAGAPIRETGARRSWLRSTAHPCIGLIDEGNRTCCGNY